MFCFLMVKMTAFKQAGEYRDALSCRMMFPLDSQSFISLAILEPLTLLL